MEERIGGFARIGGALGGFFSAIGRFFAEFGTAVVKGDAFVKLSLLWWGAGYARRKQFAKALIMTLLEAAIIWFTLSFAMEYVPKFSTLGTVQAEQVFNIATMQSEWNDYDNSFMILLFSLFSFVVWAVALVVWMRNVVNVYQLQLQAQQGRHVNNFVEDLKSYLDEKFHITLLSLPVLGIVIFTVIPILLLILVAFTNYDQQHMPPTNLFTWVGFANFSALFGGSITSTFGYAFVRAGLDAGVVVLRHPHHLLRRHPYVAAAQQQAHPRHPPVAHHAGDDHCRAAVRFAAADAKPLLQHGPHQHLLRQHRPHGDIGLISSSTIPFLSAPGWAHVMIILINIWVGIPYQMLIATGVLMNLPTDQLESARIDGANPFQTFRHITMPYMLFVTGPALVTDFVKNFNNFNVIYLLTQDVYVTTDQFMAASQAREVDLLVTWLFNLTQNYYNYKMASVIGIMVFVVCAVFTLIAFNFMIGGNKEEGYQ